MPELIAPIFTATVRLVRKRAGVTLARQTLRVHRDRKIQQGAGNVSSCCRRRCCECGRQRSSAVARKRPHESACRPESTKCPRRPISALLPAASISLFLPARRDSVGHVGCCGARTRFLLSLTLPGREQGRLARSPAASTRQLPTRSSLRTMTAAPYTLEEFAQADLHDVLDRLSLQEKVSLLAGPDW